MNIVIIANAVMNTTYFTSVFAYRLIEHTTYSPDLITIFRNLLGDSDDTSRSPGKNECVIHNN